MNPTTVEERASYWVDQIWRVRYSLQKTRLEQSKTFLQAVNEPMNLSPQLTVSWVI